jgi:hypothetical protein
VVGVEGVELGGVVELVAEGAGVGVGFGVGAFGDEAVMHPEIELVILDGGGAGVLGDGDEIDEQVGEDEFAIDQHGVAG